MISTADFVMKTVDWKTIIINVFGNIIMFTPFGFLGIVFPKLNDFKTLIIDFLSVIIIIESLQYFTRLGVFDIDDIILCEYGTTVVGLEMLRAVNEESAEETRKLAVVKSAISTLSFSEMEAIVHIFDELNGMEGVLVASKIADRVGITRSVIVNALRKFESAGVIESRSSGMKGTYIKVLNDVVFDEIKKLKQQI